MNLKIFTSELVEDWRKYTTELRGMAGPEIIDNKERGLKGEISAINKLKKDFKDLKYKFELTPNSKSPADIIGLRENPEFWHFALYQVKTSIELKSLTSEISEKETLPILAKILKNTFLNSDQAKYYKKKPLYITIGYLGVLHSKGKNKIEKRIPYKKDFTLNGLLLTSSEKTEIKNKLHR
ncbi:hypothetical protein [Yeosuana sp.]|uniref:hypothetical protein n=1 Tax=Yeosuana sp. TaxID=2529388 RepID=UPI00404A579D